jgi:serine/threonine protein kinase
VIHRDLKPSNLLVTEQDGTPIPSQTYLKFPLHRPSDR